MGQQVEPEPGTNDRPKVEVRRSSRRKSTVTAYRERDTIVVLLPSRMSAREEQKWVDQMVRRVLAKETRASGPQDDTELAERASDLSAAYLAPALGEAPEPASITWVGNQQHRWGSCTPSTRTIRISERLRPMPSWVVDYVIVHELTHLVEPSHSARFWSLVSAYPQTERARGYLEGYQAAGGAAPMGASEEPPHEID